jgi:hypothetical protein
MNQVITKSNLKVKQKEQGNDVSVYIGSLEKRDGKLPEEDN